MKPIRWIAAMSLTKPIFAEALIAPAHLFEAIAGDYLFLCFYISVILETYSAKAIGHTESMYTRRSGFISSNSHIQCIKDVIIYVSVT